jgi:hypothetical protein
MQKAFGRTLNPRTMMYEFSDGSGVPLPTELVQQIKCDITEPIGGTIIGLARKWQYEDKVKKELI